MPVCLAARESLDPSPHDLSRLFNKPAAEFSICRSSVEFATTQVRFGRERSLRYMIPTIAMQLVKLLNNQCHPDYAQTSTSREVQPGIRTSSFSPLCVLTAS